MMPNLRYDKKTSRILNAIKNPEGVPYSTFNQLIWHTENSNKIFACEKPTLFGTHYFIATFFGKVGRLFHLTQKGFDSVLLVENMESFLEKCAFHIISPQTDLHKVLIMSSMLPFNGIVRSDDNAIQVYNHKNEQRA